MDVFMAFPLIIMALAIVAIFGTGALQAGDNEAAARHFGAAIAADPHSGALQRNLASAWRALGDEARELAALDAALAIDRSEEHTSELQSLMRISYAVFFLKKKNQ